MILLELENLGQEQSDAPVAQADKAFVYFRGNSLKVVLPGGTEQTIESSAAGGVTSVNSATGAVQVGQLRKADATVVVSVDSAGIVHFPLASGSHLVADTDGVVNIGVGPETSGAARRFKKMFLSDALLAGNILGVVGPYGLNNPLITGVVAAGNSSNTGAMLGANTSLFNNGVNTGFMAFLKDGSAANSPGFFNADTAGDYDVYFGLGHRTSATENRLKFGYDGTLTLMKSSGANLLWATTGGGSIGASASSGCPQHIFASGNIRVAGSLGVGNTASASSLGTVTRKMEVFDASGTSLGFVPIYNTIT